MVEHNTNGWILYGVWTLLVYNAVIQQVVTGTTCDHI